MSQNRGEQMSQTKGEQMSQEQVYYNQLGKVMEGTRRAFSVTIVRALCLLERLSQLEALPGGRWQVAGLREEERRRQDRQAFDLVWETRGACGL